MKVIATRSLMFTLREKGEVKTGSGKELAVLKKFTIHASPSPQDAPDWIKKTPAYQHCLDSKVIREVKFVDEDESPKSKAKKNGGKDKDDAADDGKDGKSKDADKDSEKDKK